MDLRATLRAALTECDATPPLRPGGVVRASGFAELCPREEVLIAREGLVRKRERDADNLLTLAHGHGLHFALQNHVLPKVGVLHGVWRCLHCAHLAGAPPESEPFRVESGVPAVPLASFLVPRPTCCPQCGRNEWLYKELHFESVEHGIGGHPDGYLTLAGMPGLGLLEIKSTGRPFEVRSAPYVAHAIQVQIYLWFTGLAWAKVLYWSKGDWGMKALIEHTIHRDDETIASIQAALSALWTGIDGGALPSRICVTREAPRAKTCHCAKACFATPEVAPEPESEPIETSFTEAAAGEIF